jgi:hypothetical protein
MLLQVFSIPVAVISLIEDDVVWSKCKVGLPGVEYIGREISFCPWTLLPRHPEVLVVTHAPSDARFKNNAAVLELGVTFYAGCPLVSSSGHRLGTFCLIDLCTRYFTMEDCNLLSNLAEMAVRTLEKTRSTARRNFGEGVGGFADPLRPMEVWNGGVLMLQIGACFFGFVWSNCCWVARSCMRWASES